MYYAVSSFGITSFDNRIFTENFIIAYKVPFIVHSFCYPVFTKCKNKIEIEKNEHLFYYITRTNVLI